MSTSPKLPDWLYTDSPYFYSVFSEHLSPSRDLSMIYHLAKKPAWHSAQALGIYKGLPADRLDGFLHMSTASQIEESARKHRKGEEDLVLLFIDEDALPEDALVWEESRGGALFPHLYADLPVSAVVNSVPLSLDSEGLHVFPDLID